ncbi:MAG: hypothetical protein AB7O50_16100 [Pseudolabrys sp.]
MTGLRSILSSVVLLLCGASSASAAMLISEDRGGQIGAYLQAFTSVRDSGERVIIDGNCLSACTILLGIVPRDRVCATPRARLGFHAAWMPDETGRPVTSPLGTQALWNIYPPHVRRVINRHGGLSRKMIYVQGRELARLVQPCGTPTRRAARNSPQRFGANALRDARASAARNRR